MKKGIVDYVSNSIIERFIWEIAKNTAMTEERALKLLVISNNVYVVIKAAELLNKGFDYTIIYKLVCIGLDPTEEHYRTFNNLAKQKLI